MPRVELEIHIQDIKRKVRKAAEVATGRTAIEASRLIRGSMPGSGSAAIDSQDRGTGESDIFVPSTPGQPPGVRSGNLQRSITAEKIRAFAWAVSTNWPYARIHEEGGEIDHPGGTPYIVTKDGAVFISKGKAAELESRGKHVGYTRPHTITMPARPFFRPTLIANEEYLRQFFAKQMRSQIKAVI